MFQDFRIQNSILKLSQCCAAEFWCIIDLTNILRLLPRKNSTLTFFNLMFLLLLSERVLSLESCLAILPSEGYLHIKRLLIKNISAVD